MSNHWLMSNIAELNVNSRVPFKIIDKKRDWWLFWGHCINNYLSITRPIAISRLKQEKKNRNWGIKKYFGKKDKTQIYISNLVFILQVSRQLLSWNAKIFEHIFVLIQTTTACIQQMIRTTMLLYKYFN